MGLCLNKTKPKTLFTIHELEANRKRYLVMLLSPHFLCLQCSLSLFTIYASL